MEMQKAFWVVVASTVALLPAASIAGPSYDGNWTTHLACEAHEENPAYNGSSPAPLKTVTSTECMASPIARAIS